MKRRYSQSDYKQTEQLVDHEEYSIFSIFCIIALLTKNKLVGFISIVLAILIGYSRVYLCQHFYEDVFVGALIGGIGSLLIYSYFENKTFGNWGEKSLLKLK